MDGWKMAVFGPVFGFLILVSPFAVAAVTGWLLAWLGLRDQVTAAFTAGVAVGLYLAWGFAKVREQNRRANE
jgi:Flp pilus assembly protein TadB